MDPGHQHYNQQWQPLPQQPVQPQYQSHPHSQPYQQVRSRVRVRWVASPPPGAWPRRQAAIAERYNGPPFYSVPPRWGFPNVTWRPPTAVPGTASDELSPVQRLRVVARSTVWTLWVLAALALVSGGAEVWRYVLLVQSRDSALNTQVVDVSDTLVVTVALLMTIFSLVPAGLALWWLFVARLAAADRAGEDPPRSHSQVALGMLVPGYNLVMAGSIVSELEHAVLRRPSDRRPAPSRLVLGWWAAWVINLLLAALVLWWRLRDGVQAEADSVLLIALNDLSAAALAMVTALAVRRMTELLAPVNERKVRPMRVLKVTGAPDPELRYARPSGSPR
jgi:hypothetical protein